MFGTNIAQQTHQLKQQYQKLFQTMQTIMQTLKNFLNGKENDTLITLPKIFYTDAQRLFLHLHNEKN